MAHKKLPENSGLNTDKMYPKTLIETNKLQVKLNPTVIYNL